MTTKIATGHNNAGALAALNPQPAITPGQFAQLDYALSGAVNLQGRYVALQFADTITETDWFRVFAQCGLSFKNAVYAADVTLQTVNDEDASTTNYNGTARYFADGSRQFRFWKTTIYIVNMVAI